MGSHRARHRDVRTGALHHLVQDGRLADPAVSLDEYHPAPAVPRGADARGGGLQRPLALPQDSRQHVTTPVHDVSDAVKFARLYGPRAGLAQLCVGRDPRRGRSCRQGRAVRTRT
jgi:hypothetical protein